MIKKYDESKPKSIEKFGKKLEANSLSDIYNVSNLNINKKNKGGLGHLIETLHFGYEINSNKEADFIEAGVELKVIPLKKIKIKPASGLIRERNGLSVKERMVLSIIDYIEVSSETWSNNSLSKKINKLLLPFYIYEKDKEITDYIFNLVSLWSPSKNDLKMIENDWKKITNKIREGRAHELSEGDTMYLGACTKGSSAKTLRKQPFSEIDAKQRAFSFKRSYVDMIYEELLQLKEHQQNKEISLISEEDINFEDTLERIFRPYYGKTAFEIEKELGLDYAKVSKQYYSLLANHIMGVKKEDEIEEIKKADIKLKTTRLKPNGIPVEHLSFPTIDFIKLSKEEWEESELKNMIEETKFLFVVFKIDYSQMSSFTKLSSEEKRKYIKLDTVKLWNMPMTDIEYHLKNVWEKTKEIVIEGIKTTVINGRRCNNFPKATENIVAHIRPHAKNAADTLPLPNGDEFTKQSFWLNAKYISEILK